MFSIKKSEQLTDIGKNTWNVTLSTMQFWQVVCLIFIVAKIFNLITWSWWWVFAPIWGPFALLVGIIVLVLLSILIIYLVCLLLDKIIAARKARARKKLRTKVLGTDNTGKQ